MKKRIAMISEHASPLAILGGTDSGGQNVYVGQVARHLAMSGHEVDVFTRRDNPLLPETVMWQGVRVVHVPAGPAAPVPKEEMFPLMDSFTSWVSDFIRENGPYDMAHANFWMSAWAAVRLRRELELPFAVTFHALGKVRRMHQKNADRFPDERFEAETVAIREADRIIAECPQDREDLLLLYGADPEKIRMVPCGVDPSEFWPMDKRQARKLLGIPQDERVLLQLGRLVPRKGVDNAVRGFAAWVRRAFLPARLVIVGGESEQPDPAFTPEIGRLLHIAGEEGVRGQVFFMGRQERSRLRIFYSAADVFISTPWYEPFGITPLEAMACGVPVIGSEVGGIKYTVIDGQTGYLVPPNDPEALAGKLETLFESDEVQRRFSRAALERASLHTWRRASRRLDKVFDELVPEQEVGGIFRRRQIA
jgi:D-inositol-3-phosphate glycosyltransferase